MLAAIVSLRELVADGARYVDETLPADVVAEVDVRLEGLERDLGDLVGLPSSRFSCGHCGLRFRFPGELDHHLRFGHQGLEEAA